MNNALEIYGSFSKPPPEALKPSSKPSPQRQKQQLC